MLNRSFTGFTTLMIYVGTLLLSILSFFTSFFGMSILMNTPLALIGSLGLQIAMLGIAWNLMKVKENRAIYMSVFLVAASFSIVFSFANFDTNLRVDTRTDLARKNYAEAASPIMSEYKSSARLAALNGRYQVQRLKTLVDLEEHSGWATVIDEGSGDPFIQSVIDGARRTVESWKEHNGTEYHQGKGKGIILSYFEDRLEHARNNLEIANFYIARLDSLSLTLNSELTVQEQHDLVNHAWVAFPSSAVSLLNSKSAELSPPPNRADFIEKAKTRQQSFKLVIDDLIRMDSLTIFALILAIAIDFVVIMMAIAGSYVVEDVDYLFDRVRLDTTQRIKNMAFNDSRAMITILKENLERVRRAGQYGIDLSRVVGDYHKNKEKFKITLKRQGEESMADSDSALDETYSVSGLSAASQFKVGYTNRLKTCHSSEKQNNNTAARNRKTNSTV